MWEIILIILGTMVFDWGLGYLINYNKKKQVTRDEEVFLFKLEQILASESTPINKRVDKAKELSRMTKGKMAAGTYLALDYLYIK